MSRILITGATGHIGGLLALRLLRNKAQVRLLVRDFNRVPDQLRQAEVVSGEFGDLIAMRRALTGVERVFFYTPQHLDASLFPLAAECGVKQIVLLSSASVVKVSAQSDNPVAQRHRRAEQAVQESGIDWTFLRPDLLASNSLQWAPSILANDEVRVPYPESLRNPIHEDDIALIAAHALLTSKLSRSALTLTGPKALTIAEQVRLISKAVGRSITCVRISPEEAIADYMGSHPEASPRVAKLLVEYQHKTVTQAAANTVDFLNATGIEARTFGKWAQDHRAAFTP